MTRRSRRDLLRTAGMGLMAGVAGCVGGGGQSSPTAEADVIRDTSFEGKFLIVELAPEHDVSRLNLIGPEGSLHAETSVATGETKAKLELVNIQPEPSYKHYTPGEHELIAVTDDHEFSKQLELRPKFELTSVEQNRDPEYKSQLGNLAFTFENTGSAPSWVYDIVFSGAPNASANDDLSESPGNPLLFLSSPDEKEALITRPGDSQTYVSNKIPFLFENQEEQKCGGEFEISAIIGFPTQNPANVRIKADVGGDVVDAGLTGEYTCSDIEIEVLDG